MSLPYATSIQTDSARMVRALDANRDAPIIWCGDWTVKDCARHVGGLHHVLAGVIEGRPTANFGLFKTLGAPKVDDPGLGQWFAEGTAALLEQINRTSPDEPCWSFWGPEQTVSFWPRRSAHESFVHRWDMERAAGVDVAAADPVMAAEGVDEYLDVFAGMLRGGNQSPGAGETLHVHCTDTPGEWLIVFPAVGERTLTREHAKGDVAFRGPAEGLLLFLWGRLTAEEAGVDTIGDAAIAARLRELLPSV
jgi:uncharacterized protein (TIGR03083 family)